MAVYYKWIKGCQPGASLLEKQWTYVSWGSGDSITNPTVGNMPKIGISIGKKESDSADIKDLGYVLTSNMPKPLIQTEFRFNHKIYLTDSSYTTENEILDKAENPHPHTILESNARGEFYIKTTSVNSKKEDISTIKLVAKTTNIGPDLGQSDNTTLKISSYEKRTDDGVVVDGKTTLKNTKSDYTGSILDVKGSSYFGVDSSNNSTAFFPLYAGASTADISFNTNLNIINKACNALYFNATSDVRAKENIKPATYNALELIKKLQIYTYNYINKPETVTGILAQDLLEAQPKELDLVSNINATGENNDYMSIKNDKLMFVLMKAIQEQQEQIETLKAELAKLKNS